VLGSAAVSVVPPTAVTFGSRAGVLAATARPVRFGSQLGCERRCHLTSCEDRFPLLTRLREQRGSGS